MFINTDAIQATSNWYYWSSQQTACSARGADILILNLFYISPVFGEPRRRGARQPRAADRTGGDRESRALADGIAEPAGRRLRRRVGEAQQPLLRHHQSELRPEARGGRHRLPGAAEPVLRAEDVRAAQLAAQEQHQLLLGAAGVADERGGRGRGSADRRSW